MGQALSSVGSTPLPSDAVAPEPCRRHRIKSKRPRLPSPETGTGTDAPNEARSEAPDEHPTGHPTTDAARPPLSKKWRALSQRCLQDSEGIRFRERGERIDSVQDSEETADSIDGEPGDSFDEPHGESNDYSCREQGHDVGVLNAGDSHDGHASYDDACEGQSNDVGVWYAGDSHGWPGTTGHDDDGEWSMVTDSHNGNWHSSSWPSTPGSISWIGKWCTIEKQAQMKVDAVRCAWNVARTEGTEASRTQAWKEADAFAEWADQVLKSAEAVTSDRRSISSGMYHVHSATGTSSRENPVHRKPSSLGRGDARFAKRKVMVEGSKWAVRQYVCDSCRSTVTRRRNRLPEYDGQFLNLHVLTGQCGPERLEKEWRAGAWDATWWCTACWAQTKFGYSFPLKDVDQTRVRYLMGILSNAQMAKASYGKRRWGTEFPKHVVASAVDDELTQI